MIGLRKRVITYGIIVITSTVTVLDTLRLQAKGQDIPPKVSYEGESKIPQYPREKNEQFRLGITRCAVAITISLSRIGHLLRCWYRLTHDHIHLRNGTEYVFTPGIATIASDSNPASLPRLFPAPSSDKPLKTKI